MTIIVAVAKEMSITADRYILAWNKENETVSSVARYEEQKIKISDDNHFAYVFCGEQKEEVIPLILNYLLRFEKGLVKPDEKIEWKSEEPLSEIIILSRQFLYAATYLKKDQLWTLQKKLTGAATYPILNNALVSALDLPGHVIRQALVNANKILHSDHVDEVKHTQLTLIKKATKKEIANALLS